MVSVRELTGFNPLGQKPSIKAQKGHYESIGKATFWIKETP